MRGPYKVETRDRTYWPLDAKSARFILARDGGLVFARNIGWVQISFSDIQDA
jgi:hypothetical protein